MRKIVILLLLSLISINSFSQTSSGVELTKKEKKALKKAEQAKQDSLNAIAFKATLESKQWVLEAYQVSFNNGRSFNVTPTLNFIAIEGEEAFIQIGSISAYGYNGVGGITVKGRV